MWLYVKEVRGKNQSYNCKPNFDPSTQGPFLHFFFLSQFNKFSKKFVYKKKQSLFGVWREQKERKRKEKQSCHSSKVKEMPLRRNATRKKRQGEEEEEEEGEEEEDEGRVEEVFALVLGGIVVAFCVCIPFFLSLLLVVRLE
jgi:thiol:disulfide interchange protein